jgi:predicted nucleic acid-binding protein
VKRILVDTNVILDVLLDREPHLAASAAIWIAVETGVVQGLLAAHAVTTIHYLISKQLGAAKARRIMGAVLRVFAVAPVDMAVLREALQSTAPDFEDSVTASAAQLAGCDLIVTRDIRGFRGAGVRVLTPEAAALIARSSK